MSERSSHSPRTGTFACAVLSARCKGGRDLSITVTWWPALVGSDATRVRRDRAYQGGGGFRFSRLVGPCRLPYGRDHREACATATGLAGSRFVRHPGPGQVYRHYQETTVNLRTLDSNSDPPSLIPTALRPIPSIPFRHSINSSAAPCRHGVPPEPPTLAQPAKPSRSSQDPGRYMPNLAGPRPPPSRHPPTHPGRRACMMPRVSGRFGWWTVSGRWGPLLPHAKALGLGEMAPQWFIAEESDVSFLRFDAFFFGS